MNQNQHTIERPVEDQFDDHLGLQDVDYVEHYVNNAKQTAHYYQTTFGFELKAFAGLQTGIRDRASYYLEQGNIRFVITAPLNSSSPIAQFVHRHGDGVKDIAMHVEDVDRAFHESVKRGAVAVEEPHDITDKNGTIRKAAIKTWITSTRLCKT